MKIVLSFIVSVMIVIVYRILKIIIINMKFYNMATDAIYMDEIFNELFKIAKSEGEFGGELIYNNKYKFVYSSTIDANEQYEKFIKNILDYYEKYESYFNSDEELIELNEKLMSICINLRTQRWDRTNSIN